MSCVHCKKIDCNGEHNTPATRLWRTMFHVIYIYNDEYWVRIPGWDSNIAVRITSQNIDPNMLHLIRVDGRYYGQCTLGAHTVENLYVYINEFLSFLDG